MPEKSKPVGTIEKNRAQGPDQGREGLEKSKVKSLRHQSHKESGVPVAEVFPERDNTEIGEEQKNTHNNEPTNALHAEVQLHEPLTFNTLKDEEKKAEGERRT